jgi:hypothetical protein
MNKYEFKMQHFSETGKWLTKKGLDEEYEEYLSTIPENMIRCPKCNHEFEHEDGDSQLTEEEVQSSKEYQKSGLEYLQRLNDFTKETE